MSASGSGNGRSISFRSGATGEQKFTGPDATTPYLSGTAEFSFFYGAYVLSESATRANEVVFKVTSSDLTYDHTTCTTAFYKDGSIVFEDGAGNRIKATYTNCVLAWTYNDESSTATLN